MRRPGLILTIVLGVVLLTAGGWWIATHLEKVPVTRDEPPQPEAQHNHYLALERFMARMGRSIVSTGDVRTLDKLPPHGVLILDRHHRAVLTQARLKTLFDWVGRGGYLIVVPEDSDEPDPVMSYLHVHWDDDVTPSCDCPHHDGAGAALPASAPAATPAPAAPRTAARDPSGAGALLPASAPLPTPVSSPFATAPAPAITAPMAASAPLAAPGPLAASAPAATNGTGADDADQAAGDDVGEDSAGNDDEGDDGEDDAATDNAPSPQTFPALIPGASRPLLIEMQYSGLAPGDIAPAWKVPLDDKSAWLLDYRYGVGNVSLVANLDHLVSNASIADYDHAEFLWKLLEHYQPAGPVTLMTRLPVPDLFDWMVDTAWAASLSGLVLLALWLWQIAPRFGGTAPDRAPSRRELREHLNAVGRFVWRNEGFGRWLEVSRTAFRERLAMRHPAIAALDPHGQVEALARLTGLPREQVLHALTAGPVKASDFTAMLRTLKHLKHNL